MKTCICGLEAEIGRHEYSAAISYQHCYEIQEYVGLMLHWIHTY